MFRLRLRWVFLAINGAAFFSLLYLGCYFIIESNIWERFQQKKSNFAEFTEPMTELPTAMIWIEYHQNNYQTELMLAVDFNITYAKRGETAAWNTLNEATLKEGENWISGLKVKLEISYSLDKRDHNTSYYRITHENFRRGSLIQPIDFGIKFRFKSQKISSIVSRIYMALSTKNNSFCGKDSKSYDGAWGMAPAKPGEVNYLQIIPKKILYSSLVEKCREEPYSDELMRQIAKQMMEKCSKICRAWDFYMCNNITDLTKIPICKTTTEKQCFDNAWPDAGKEIIKKPCTKMQYEVEDNTVIADNTLSAEFRTIIQKEVTVKEEFLIFDLVSLISAVGGTMGLCIGFSFLDLTWLCLNYIELGFYKIRIKMGLSGQIAKSEESAIFNNDMKEQIINDLQSELRRELRNGMEAQFQEFKIELRSETLKELDRTLRSREK